MRLKNVPFKKSLKDELRNRTTPKNSNDFKDLGLKNPEGTVYKDDLSETKKILGSLKQIMAKKKSTKTNPKKR